MAQTATVKHDADLLADSMIEDLFEGAKKLEPETFAEPARINDQNVPIDPGLLPDATAVGLILMRNIDYPNEGFFIPDRDTNQYSGEMEQFIDGNLILKDTEEGRWRRDFILSASRSKYLYVEPTSGPEYKYDKTGFVTRNQDAFQRYIDILIANT